MTSLTELAATKRKAARQTFLEKLWSKDYTSEDLLAIAQSAGLDLALADKLIGERDRLLPLVTLAAKYPERQKATIAATASYTKKTAAIQAKIDELENQLVTESDNLAQVQQAEVDAHNARTALYLAELEGRAPRSSVSDEIDEQEQKAAYREQLRQRVAGQNRTIENLQNALDAEIRNASKLKMQLGPGVKEMNGQPIGSRTEGLRNNIKKAFDGLAALRAEAKKIGAILPDPASDTQPRECAQA